MAMVRKDGTRMWVQLIGYLVNPADPGQGTIWIVADRTAHKRAEESLRNALLENQAILDNAVLGIAVVEQGRSLHCNRKMEELFGYGAGEVDGVEVRSLYPDEAGWQAAHADTARDFAAGAAARPARGGRIGPGRRQDHRGAGCTVPWQIVAVGDWVLRQACEQAVRWQGQGLRAVALSVNLSARQFMHASLLASIGRIVDETGIDPALVEFELTETALMQYGAQTASSRSTVRSSASSKAAARTGRSWRP